MQNMKRGGRVPNERNDERTDPEPVDHTVEDEFSDDEPADAYDTFEMYRVICPDCAQPIALLADETALPEHALCPSPWNPFVLTVCAGTGRPASQSRPADTSKDVQEQDTALLLTLPQGLDWRTQPFSHVGGPGSRPLRVPQMRRAA
ncbi:hypothetical protein [Streptomyces crystallinus]|uniref:Uncharacterized protein n=1 Tax=Streptomyces crystallinus TaxID=68191 RepID=A0ABN1GV15_9ACTN